MRENKKKILYVVVAVAAIVTLVYLGLALFFTKHFYFNTFINGENYSAGSVNSAQNFVLDTSNHYTLTINGRDGITDTITSADIGLKLEFGEEFQNIIETQDAFLWPFSLFKKCEYTVDTMVTYSEEAFDNKIDTLCFFEQENIRQPQNAYLSDYTEEGYQIIPEDKGTVPIRTKIYNAVKESVEILADSVDLDAKECYTNAEIVAEDHALQKECDALNQLTGVKITYKFGEDREVLDGSIIKDWLVTDEGKLDIDPDLVREYVNTLSKKYDTWGKKREFKTTGGETITISEGAYGWWMNRAGEAEALVELIRSGKSEERTPLYHAQAAQYGENDIGDSYVEIDLTSQHLWVYKDDQLVEETDFVSGNVSRGYNTPVGIYGITYKERNTTLRGANYASKVSFWMPFNGNVGMHDASWRSSFGANIYLTNGSHGCVNLPSKKAEVIYGYVEQGEPVIVYGGQVSVPRTEGKQEQPEVTVPEENITPELTPEQQIQILIEAGVLNPDGTPVQQPEGVLPEVPTENPAQVPQEIPVENLESIPQEVPAENPVEIPQEVPVENPAQVPQEIPAENLAENPVGTSQEIMGDA
ncbi:MAG: L,D-transpeptidase family protein [Lachnospiraceae bacterium]|nr:L,D-transpeptidase family protein [Lachnospiraceae bacterium]